MGEGQVSARPTARCQGPCGCQGPGGKTLNLPDLVSELVPLICLKKSLFAFDPSRILLSHQAEPPASPTLTEHTPLKTMLA